MPNALQYETSPYLLQHANNPVAWLPWGNQALEKAVQEDKPILVSIGYSACHWCHVMEHESFEDEETAALMNAHFVNIKIDREERPDIDSIYMDAVQAISGSGGWPLNVFLTPNLMPFYGGTYFPPVQAYNRPSWKQVLQNIHDAFVNKRTEIESQAINLTEYLKNASQPTTKNIKPTIEENNIEIIVANFNKATDTVYGGFGNAPKFPQTMGITWQLRYGHIYKHTESITNAHHSLQCMIDGGIYDHVAGGFARYSVDNVWLAPHFEKMLYDNALLIGAISEAYQQNKNPLYKKTILQTFNWLHTEMKDSTGGYYAALDADSEGIEGKFYTWHYDELTTLLNKEQLNVLSTYSNVSTEGNWEHTNIIHKHGSVEDVAKTLNLSIQVIETILQESLDKLYKARTLRIRPGTDDKILLSWNALLITAFCKAGNALEEDSFIEEAINIATCIQQHMKQPAHGLFHTYKNGVTKINAMLDDYAFYIEALLALGSSTGNNHYYTEAEEWLRYCITHFLDEAETQFYFTTATTTDVIVRKREVYDGATPSSNATMAYNCWHIGILYNNNTYKQIAYNMVLQQQDVVTRYPTSFGKWAQLLLEIQQGTKEIAIVGNNHNLKAKEVLALYMPHKIVMQSIDEDENWPLLKHKTKTTETLIYVCENYTCNAPALHIKTTN
jgi:uncharacterized protein